MKFWTRPTANYLKLNTDGVFLPNFSFGGAAGVIRDSHSQFQACFAARQASISSPEHIELVAMQKGLHLVNALQLRSVTIESDCLMAVQAVNALACDLSPLAALVHVIRSLVNRPKIFCIPHGRIGLASKVFDQLQEGLRHAAAILTTWLGRKNLSIRASWES
ncbi:hypothetical protein ACLB2K_032873 [Fragaria x ananassa]